MAQRCTLHSDSHAMEVPAKLADRFRMIRRARRNATGKNVTSDELFREMLSYKQKKNADRIVQLTDLTVNDVWRFVRSQESRLKVNQRQPRK